LDTELVRDGLIKFISGVLLVGLLLFIPAGTFAFPAGWRFMGVLFVPMLVGGLVMLFFKPELLRKRLNAKEEQTEQKGVIAASGLMFIAAFVVAGLTFRFGWIRFPKPIPFIGAVLFLSGYALFAEVLRENEYLSRTVEVQKDQHVVDTGLYGIVRHPMYAATLVLFLSMALVLESPISFAIMLVYPALLVVRIRNEEEVLEEGLQGYLEYKKRVKYRLIPFVW